MRYSELGEQRARREIRGQQGQTEGAKRASPKLQVDKSRLQFNLTQPDPNSKSKQARATHTLRVPRLRKSSKRCGHITAM